MRRFQRKGDLLTANDGRIAKTQTPIKRKVAIGLALLVGTVASAGAFVSLGEAARPLFGWSADRLQSAADGSRPPVIALPDQVRSPPEPTAVSAPSLQQVVVESGDTLASVLGRANVSSRQAYAAISALKAVYNPRHLQVGQEIALTLTPAADGPALVGLELSARFDRYAGITLYPDGNYRSFVTPKRLARLNAQAKGAITSSLFADGVGVGAPASIMADFFRLFSFDVDFERDVHPNDRFELVFERYIDRDGNIVQNGDLRYAGLVIGGQERGYYRYDNEDGDDAYYDRNGRGIRKALLKTPIDGARRSSGYGMRRHPILGYTKMHKGTDFAAPRGTPIRAAGDGVVSFAGRQSSYGIYISIRHNGDYDTGYAHMQKLAKGMSKGKRIKQGQIIGYVGSTGRSTGPHLHYETLYKGKHVNPSKLRLPSGRSLTGADLARFTAQVAEIDEIRRQQAGSSLAAARPQ